MRSPRRVVVIGSGPAGAAAAVFLAEAGADVLVLEAGAEDAPLGVTARIRGVTIAKRRPPLHARPGTTATADPAAQVFEALAPGGLSNHWSCAVPRFSPDDFADAARGGPVHTWPIGYRDLEPWYERVETLLHVAGAESDCPELPAGRVRHAWRLPAAWSRMAAEATKTGRSIVPMPYAYGADTTLTRAATAFNAFVRLVKPRLGSGALSARFGARALRLEYAARSRRVEAVVVRTAQGEERVPCDAVVLGAGAVNTAQILLESKSADFPRGLGNTHGVLGRYLHDHPIAKIVIDLRAPLPIQPPIYVTRLALDRSRPLWAAACMQWSGVSAYARSVLRGRPGKLSTIGFSIFGSMPASPDNWVDLDETAARVQGASALALHFRHPPEATAMLEQTRDELMQLFERAGIEARVSVFKLESVLNSVHYGGTCRMHASPEFGMLDGFCRLHAVQNVAVADSASFTTTPEKNPVLTAMTLAARAANRLGSELVAGDL